MLYYGILILSFLLGSVITFFIFKNWLKNHMKKYVDKTTIKSKLKKKKTKRGLLDESFDWIGDDNKKTTVNLDVEFSVKEETDTMFKLNVVDINSNNLCYTKSYHIESYKKAFNKWYDKTDKRIKWFKEDKREIRRRKLEELLGSS